MAKKVILNQSSPQVVYLRKKDKRLAKVIDMVGPIEYSAHIDNPYAFFVHEIIEQMLSVKAGAKIYNRLLDLCHGNITPESVAALSDEEIKSIGTSYSKVTYIRNITNAVINQELVFSELTKLPDTDVIRKLTSFKGVGKWTAKMFLIFVLNREDILPIEDVAFLQSYKWMYKTPDVDSKSVEKKCAKWHPYASIASRYLYRALDMGLTKDEFHLYK